jgi:hypothetical protein
MSTQYPQSRAVGVSKFKPRVDEILCSNGWKTQEELTNYMCAFCHKLLDSTLSNEGEIFSSFFINQKEAQQCLTMVKYIVENELRSNFVVLPPLLVTSDFNSFLRLSDSCLLVFLHSGTIVPVIDLNHIPINNTIIQNLYSMHDTNFTNLDMFLQTMH